MSNNMDARTESAQVSSGESQVSGSPQEGDVNPVEAALAPSAVPSETPSAVAAAQIEPGTQADHREDASAENGHGADAAFTLAQAMPPEDLLDSVKKAKDKKAAQEDDRTDSSDNGDQAADQSGNSQLAQGADDAAAQQLAAIEPAAGESQGGSTQNTGFGFNSSVEIAPVGALSAVGPIDPTALEYGVEFQNDFLFIEEIEEFPPVAPEMDAPRFQVKEDGSVDAIVEVDNGAGAGTSMLVTISGIPAGWGVDTALSGGTYDAATGTWSLTVPNGADFIGGITLSPPADSDADIPVLTLTATITDPATGLSNAASMNTLVITDAVADTPDITANNASGNEGAPIALNISGAVTDTDGSETITGYEISGVPAGFTFNQGTDLGGGVWSFTPAEIAGLTITPSNGDYFGTIGLTVTVFNEETNLTDTEFDLADNTNQNSTQFAVEWTPEVDPPSIKVNGGVPTAQVKEDGTVDVPVIAELSGKDSPDAFLTVKITGIDPSWGFTLSKPLGSYDSTTQTWSVTLPAGQNLSTVFTFTPPADSDIDMTGLVATATATEPATSTTASATDSFDIIVDAVADNPDIDAADKSTGEGQPIAIDIHALTGEEVNNGVGGDDGSETITGYQISGVPAGFTFNQGTDLGGGVWGFTPAEIVGLQLTPPNTNFFGSIGLTATVFTTENPVSDGEFDGGDNNNQASDQFTLTWGPEIDPPSITVNGGIDDVVVKEDGSVDVRVQASLDANASPEEVLSVTITGIDPSWGLSAPIGTYNAAAGTWTVTLPAGQNLDTLLTFTPPAQSDIDLTGLSAVATSTDAAAGISADSAPDTFNIIVDAVADTPSISGANTVAAEGAPIAITISGKLGADNFDGSETITGYQISGVPTGFTFNQGTDLGGGVWGFTPAEILGLQLNPNDPNFDGSLSLTATVFITENPVSDGEVDFTDNDAQASTTIKLSWTPDIDPPSISVNEGVDDVCVKEDGSVDVRVQASLDTNASPNEVLSVTVTGIDSSWGFSSSIGTYNAAAGTWTVTVPAGQNLDTLLTFAPPADSDIDLTGLSAVATSTDTVAGISADSPQDVFNIIVDAVADVPNLSANAANGEEGTTIPLTISTSVNDTDGSEVIEVIKISNLPAGATLTAGTENGGVWTLTTADLAGLGINVPDGVFGDFTLNVESVAFEQNTNGIEKDLTDNRASAFTEIKLSVSVDTIPEIGDDEKVVDETNLGPITVNGTLGVDFFGDAPGTVTPTGAGSFAATGSIAGAQLTSQGDAVTVSVSGNQYVGTAGGRTIFTLTINNDSSYSFTLLDTLDHADVLDPDDVISLAFDVTATDSEGDASVGTVFIDVHDDGPVARDDSAFFETTDGGTSGNVVTNDTLSHDEDNTVTQVSFGGTVKDVPDGGSVTIDGDFGQLEISSDGSYTYNLFDISVIGVQETHTLSPTKADFRGKITSFLNNGILVSVEDRDTGDPANGTLTFVDTGPHAPGIAVQGNGSPDRINVSFSDSTVEATLTLVDHGSENFDDAITFLVFMDGSDTPVEIHDVLLSSAPEGLSTFTFNAVDLGGEEIDRILYFSDNVNNGSGEASFLLSDVQTTTLVMPECTDDVFEYTLTDYDGDSSTATLDLTGKTPLLIVGQNVDDVDGSTTPYEVGLGEGEITGAAAGDILIGDAGGAALVGRDQDYNFVFVLDTSGSMGVNNPNDGVTSRLEILIGAVKNMMTQFANYQNGDIKVHIVDFGTRVNNTITIDFSDPNALTTAINHLESLSSGGFTNYESPLAAALDWLNGHEPLGGQAITMTYFVSDGVPNRYVDQNGNIVNPPGDFNEENAIILAEITGTNVTTPDGTFGDNTDEVGGLQAHGEVVAVGIAVPNNDNLNAIDSDGHATYIDDPTDLEAVLQGANPLNQLAIAGDDVISGGAGDDIIFGDVLFTDDLADLQGLPTLNGVGWEVFARLEAGHGNNADWSRQDTIEYIRTHAEALSRESVNNEGKGREGGDDTLSGGASDDLIFGQEGHDVISGGAGNDVLYGGSGNDVFLFENLADGIDAIMDFEAGDILDVSALLVGYDAVTDAITDFVFKTESAGDTAIFVDANGSGNIANATQIAVLDDVTGLDIELITNNGNTAIV
ncbi:MAG: VWA domain-containing protein [Alphaproteobacteria bacterium]